MDDVLSRLERWYRSQCDDDWEHQYGVKITTLDNPGWSVKIDILRTAVGLEEFQELKLDRSDSDWVQCRVREGKFEGYGGAQNLREVIEVFLSWAEKTQI